MAAGGAGALCAGTELGAYRLGRTLGSGGMGTVYRAEVVGRVPGTETSLAAGTRVALKVVHPHLLGTRNYFERFLREAEIGSTVRHENVVRTFGSGEVEIDGTRYAFLAMEYVEGQTLTELLGELDFVPEELCRHIAREVCKGLGAIHAAGVVHRDVKPDNVLITEDHVVKIMDLGVARSIDDALKLSQTGAFVGSMHYAAPEQFKDGGRGLDGRVDLHGLGLSLYELSCGKNPYLADDVAQTVRKVLYEEPRRLGDVNPQLSPFFEEVVHALIKKERGERFADAGELLAVLEQGEEGPWWRARAKAIRVETERPLRRIRIPRETAVYGRDDEIEKLRGLYEAARAGDGRVVLIEGEAGIGKSRIVDELLGRLQRDGEEIDFLFGSYPPGGAATAAGAFSSAYREHFGEAGSAAHLGHLQVLAPAFDALLRGVPLPAGAEALTRESLQTCFVEVTRSLAADRTTVVLIDDLHFAPDEGRALFTSLALAAPGHRFLLVGTTRPGVSESWLATLTRLDQTSQLTLGRLGPKDLADLLRDSFQSEKLALGLAGQIGIKSDGNPFFAFEIIRGLREGQFITQDADGSWVSTRVIENIEIPSSVLDLVNARVADLTEEERDLLDVACCWGFEFDPGLVGDVVGMGRIPLLKRFGQIERKHRLVRSSGRNYVFDHHQVQEALHSSLHEQMREEYHGALAEALEGRTKASEKDPEDVDGSVCVDLCEHYFAGALGESALRYLGPALDHLEAGYQGAQVVALADRALAVPGLVAGEERFELLLRKARRLERLGRSDPERAALDEALVLAEADGRPALRIRAEARLGTHLYGAACYEEARQMLFSALERAREADEKDLEAAASGLLGMVLRVQGRLEEAREQHERQLAIARELGDRKREANATGDLGLVLEARGRHEEAREHHERDLALERELGERRGEAVARGNLANTLSSLGRYDESRAQHEHALAIVREIGDRRAEAQIVGNLGTVLHDRGLYEEAGEHFERALVLCQEVGHRLGEAIALANLGLLFVALGRPDAGRERLEGCLALCRDIGDRRVEGHALQELGTALESAGDTAAAERLYRETLELRHEIGNPGDIATTLARLGALLAASGREEAAVEVLTEAAATARPVGAAGAEVLSRCLLARLPGGDAGAARDSFDEFADALSAHARMEARFLLWRATSDPADLAEAHSLLEHLRDHAPQAYRDTLVENVPPHRDIMAAWKARGA